MAFHEDVFPLSLMYGMTVSLKYKTGIVTTQTMHEERLCNWLDGLRTYSITPVILDKTGFHELGAFFRARSGRTHAFRLYDPIDNAITTQSIGTGDGTRYQWQVYKLYESGISGDSYAAKRPLTKLIAPVTVSVNNVARTFQQVDLTTGIITFAVKSTPFEVTYGSTNKITRTDGGNFQTDGVLVNDIVVTSGGSSLNGSYVVSGFADGGVSLTTSSVTFVGSTTTTVTMRIPPPSHSGGHIVRVTCGFHTPVRFSTNRLGTSHATFEHYNPNGVQLIEDRIPTTLLTNSNIVEGTIPGFVEARYPFDTQLSDESEFSSRYSDQVISFDSGYEQRARRSTQGYNDYEVKYEVKPLTEIQRLIAFYHSRKGRFTGFRLKDINDYQATAEEFATADGATYEFQLTKTYLAGSESEVRAIKKPVSGTVTLYADAVALNLSTEHISIDYATGKVLYFLGSMSLSAASGPKTFTRASGSWVTDGLVNGDKIAILGSVSNNAVFTVTNVTALVLTVSETVVTEAAVAMSVYLPPATGVVLSWSGEFDVPARFNTDELQVSINGFESYNGDNVSLQEIHTEPVEIIYNERPTFTSGPLICAGRASALLSAGAVCVENPIYQWSYSILGGTATEIHKSLGGVSLWTFFVVLSHTQRGCLFDVVQPMVGDRQFTSDVNSAYQRPTAGTLSTRVFIRSRPINEAALFIETWCGTNALHWASDGFGNYGCRHNGTDTVRSGEMETPLFTESEAIVYEPMTVLIVTMSYQTSRAYVSGTVPGVVRVGAAGPSFMTYECDDKNGLVKIVPTDRYLDYWFPAGAFYGTIFGAFGANIVGHSPVSGGPLGRVYEAYFGQNYVAITSTTEEVYAKAIHNTLIRYLETKYYYRRKASLALEGTRGHWTAERDTLKAYRSGVYPDEIHTNADIGERVSRWLTDISVGNLNMVTKSPQAMHPMVGGTLVAVSPDAEMLTAPLIGFWE